MRTSRPDIAFAEVDLCRAHYAVAERVREQVAHRLTWVSEGRKIEVQEEHRRALRKARSAQKKLATAEKLLWRRA